MLRRAGRQNVRQQQGACCDHCCAHSCFYLPLPQQLQGLLNLCASWRTSPQTVTHEPTATDFHNLSVANLAMPSLELDKCTTRLG